MASDDRSTPTTPPPSPPPYADPPPTYALTPPRMTSPTRSPSPLPKLAPARGRRRYCRLPYILLIITILVIIGIAIGLGVGLGLPEKTDIYDTPPARLSRSYMALGPTSTSSSSSSSSSSFMSAPATTPTSTSTPESENGPDLNCPETNLTTLTAQEQRFMKLCGTDWPAGRAAAVEPESEDGGNNAETVQDISDGTDSNRTGIVRRTFAACVDACAEFNANNAGPGDSPALYGVRSADGCSGVSYVANMTWVDEGGVGNNRNCYLKTARAAEVVRANNDIAVGMLL